MRGLWDPRGLAGLTRAPLARDPAGVEVKVLPFSCRSDPEGRGNAMSASQDNEGHQTTRMNS